MASVTTEAPPSEDDTLSVHNTFKKCSSVFQRYPGVLDGLQMLKRIQRDWRDRESVRIDIWDGTLSLSQCRLCATS